MVASVRKAKASLSKGISPSLDCDGQRRVLLLTDNDYRAHWLILLPPLHLDLFSMLPLGLFVTKRRFWRGSRVHTAAIRSGPGSMGLLRHGR